MSAYDDCAEVGFHRLGCLCKRGAPPAMTDPRVPAPVPASGMDAPTLPAARLNERRDAIDERHTKACDAGDKVAEFDAFMDLHQLCGVAIAQLAAAREDTKRLDWMQEHGVSVDVADSEELSVYVVASDDYRLEARWPHYDIRAVIDAAALAAHQE